MSEEPFVLKYNLRHKLLAIFYYISIGISALTVGSFYAFFHCYRRNDWTDFTHMASIFFVPLFKLFGIKMTIEGKENIPKKAGFVIIANHQSFLDINAVFAGIAHTAFLAKADLWKIPYFSWAMTKTGSIPVNRIDPKKNAGMGKLLKSRVGAGYNFCVFPEGKRTNDGKMSPFKNGVFRMAKEHELTLLPLTIIDTGKRLSKSTLGLNPGPIKLIVHPIISPDQYQDKTMEELRDWAHDIVESKMPYKKLKTQEA